jgi:amino acid transporter
MAVVEQRKDRVRTRGRETQDRLERNAVGVPGITFATVAAAAPLAATLGASPFIFGAIDIGAAGMYVVAAIVLLLFAVGYATMSEHVTSAGGFAAYISAGLGRAWGFAGAYVSVLTYAAILIAIYGQLGAFAHDVFLNQLSIDLPWQVWVAIGLILVGLGGYHDIKLSIKVLGVLLITEVLVLLVLDFTVIGDGGDSGLSGTPFEPSNIFSGAPGVGALFAFSAFVGFETSVVYGEEAHDPKRTVPRATYAGLVAIAVFYVLTIWAITMGYGTAHVTDSANADPVNFVFNLNDRYVGTFSTDLMNYLAITSLTAVLLSVHNALARYIFATGRAGVLPRQLGRTGGRKGRGSLIRFLIYPGEGAPYVASLLVTAVSAAVVAVFAIFGADPLTQLFAWLIGFGTVGVLGLEAAVSIAILAFFRSTRVDTRPWQTVIAPLLGLAGLLVVVYLSLHNFDTLVGTTGIVTYLPWLYPLTAAIGLVVAHYTRREGVDLARDMEEPVTAAAPAEAGP